MYKKHKSDALIIDDDLILWHYTNVDDLKLLLQDNKLRFTNIETLRKGDPLEGEWGDIFEQVVRDQFISKAPFKTDLKEKLHDGWKLLNDEMRKSFYTHSWHISNKESSKMWKKYAKVNGLVIQSTFKRLKESFIEEERDVFIRPAYYKDGLYWPDFSDTLPHFFSKAETKKSEKEMRALTTYKPRSQASSRTVGTKLPPNIFIDVNVGILIERVVISSDLLLERKDELTALLNLHLPNIKLELSRLDI